MALGDGTDRASEAAVALERRDRALGADVLLGGLVELGGADAFADLAGDQLHRRRVDGAGGGHLLDLGGRLLDDHGTGGAGLAGGGAGVGRVGFTLVFEPQRRHRRAHVVVHLGGRARAVEAAQEVAALVVVDERLGLLVVDGQPLADRLGLVVVALDQRGAVDVAAIGMLGRVEVDVVDAARLAHAATRKATHDLLVGNVDQQDRADLAPGLLQRRAEGICLRHRARKAVEQEAVGGLV